MSRLCWDVETDGLLDEVTILHCIATVDVDTMEECLYADLLVMNTQGTIAQGIEKLRTADLLIGHNLIKYDHPVLKKLTGVSLPKDKIFDTLVATRLVWSNIKDLDNVKSYRLGSMFGNHSLEAWGIRLGGQQKIQYAPVMDPSQPVYDPKVKFPKKEPRWKGSTFTAMMGEYCLQDVRVNTELFHRIERKVETLNYHESIKLEHDAAWLLAQQERNGFKFDERKAQALLSVLSARRELIYDQLVSSFCGWYKSEGLVEPKRTLNYKDPMQHSRVAGAKFTKIKWVDFNPSSRLHIIRVLKMRGWKPTEFTPSGEAKVDETVLNKMSFPEAPLMAEWFLLQKRLGQLSDGKAAWLTVVHRDGYIRGSINPNGAVTGRATHSYPNLGQIPSCKAVYGPECRDLFTVPDDWVLFGSDASGLELRCLAEAMSEYDKGVYIDTVLNGDIHVSNQIAAGLMTRGEAKTFIYAFLYGCGPELTGEQIGWSEDEYLEWKKQGTHLKLLARKNNQRRRMEPPERPLVLSSALRDSFCNIMKGEEVQKKFMKGLPSLKKLIDACKALHKTQGYIMGIDGRRIFTRSQHAALNTKLQGMGAVICKAWIIEGERLVLEAGYKHGLDGDFMQCAWVHDEVQIACRTREIAEHFGELYQLAMRNVQKRFNIKCRLDTDFNIGASWKETH
jgi:DNA polymerase-1